MVEKEVKEWAKTDSAKEQAEAAQAPDAGQAPLVLSKMNTTEVWKTPSSMKKADKVKVVLELAQNHINDNAST